MPQTTTAPHIEELIRALGEKVGDEVTAEQLEAQFNRYLEYGVPADQAKRTILRHYGGGAGNPGGGASDERTKLADLEGDESFVNLVVKVVHIEDRDVTVRGDPKTITTGLLADETMSRSFTAWSRLEGIEKGDTLRITGAYCKMYRSQPEIHLGDKATVEKTEESELPADADGVRTFQVADLEDGLRNVQIKARVLTVAPKEVTVKDEPKTVWSGTLGDGTGKVQFSAWHDFGLEEGQLVEITGAYVRGWRGTPQLTFDDRSTVEVVEDDSFPSLDEIQSSGPVPIGRFVGGSGQVDVTVEGTVLEVRPGSGLIERCGECNRALQEGECGEHGATEGRPDLRIKAVLDDGTGALNLVAGRDLTEAVLGKDLEACQNLAAEGGDPEVVASELRSKLVARPYRVRGNVLTDDFGPMLIAQDLTAVQRDLTAAVEALLAELGEVA